MYNHRLDLYRQPGVEDPRERDVGSLLFENDAAHSSSTTAARRSNYLVDYSRDEKKTERVPKTRRRREKGSRGKHERECGRRAGDEAMNEKRSEMKSTVVDT